MQSTRTILKLSLTTARNLRQQQCENGTSRTKSNHDTPREKAKAPQQLSYASVFGSTQENLFSANVEEDQKDQNKRKTLWSLKAQLQRLTLLNKVY